MRRPLEAVAAAATTVRFDWSKWLALAIALARTILNSYFITANWARADQTFSVFPQAPGDQMCANEEAQRVSESLPVFWSRMLRLLTWAELILLWGHIIRYTPLLLPVL